MLMKPPAPASPRAELADIEIAVAVHLRQSQAGHVQSAAVVKVELGRLIEDGLGIARGAEAEAAGRNASDHAWLGGEREQIDDPFLVWRRWPLPRACRCRG